MKISVIGDSFSCDTGKDSWVSLLASQHQVENFSQRGISQYRLYRCFEQNIKKICSADCVIFWHTNPDRVFVNDDILIGTRELRSHPFSDLVAADALSCDNNQWKTAAEIYYKFFFNQEQQNLFHRCLVDKIFKQLRNTRSLHCSGFAINDDRIKSFLKTKQTYPGNINHMNAQGNLEVYDYITGQL